MKSWLEANVGYFRRRAQARELAAAAASALAKAKQKNFTDQLYLGIGETCAAALALRPDMPDALATWGDSFLRWRDRMGRYNDTDDRLLTLAVEKYRAALALDPNTAQALYGWAAALGEQAGSKRGEERFQSLVLAGEKYVAAVTRDPGLQEWGNSWDFVVPGDLWDWRRDYPAQLDALIDGTFAAALAVKTDKAALLYRWASCLANRASEEAKASAHDAAYRAIALASEKVIAALAFDSHEHGDMVERCLWSFEPSQELAQGDTTGRILTLACETCAAALAIRPNLLAALDGWADALLGLAAIRDGDEADRLADLANEKQAAALALRADTDEKVKALNDWAQDFATLARSKTGAQADRFWAMAGDKHAAAMALNPGAHWVLWFWITGLLDQARAKTGEEAGRLYGLAAEKCVERLRLKPGDTDVLRPWGTALLGQAQTATGEEADRREALGNQKFRESIPSAYILASALCDWGDALLDLAKSRTGAEAERLLASARENYLAALTQTTGADRAREALQQLDLADGNRDPSLRSG